MRLWFIHIEPVRRVLKFLELLRLWPLSLAEKCRLAFGLAVIFSLALALLLPYVWMGQLVKKDLLDSNRARAEALLLRRHFQPLGSGQGGLPVLDSSGAAMDVNNPEVRWFHFTKDKDKIQQLSEDQKAVIEALKNDQTRDEDIKLARQGGRLVSNYVLVFRASDRCISCHNPQGAGAFGLKEPIGVALIQSGGVGGDISRTILLNRIWIVVAGLIGGTGAIVAFYWITQRVILRPVRQLRAMVNNVAEGNLEVRSSITTRDEYEKLSTAFNHMLDGLQAAQEKLREANRQLDAKIAELSQRNIELYKANKVKSDFLATMSHEFKTPLNAILGFAQVLRDKPKLAGTDKGRRYAENIISSGNNLLSMINDILELARTQSGMVELHVEHGTVAQIFESLTSVFSLMTTKKRIRLGVHVAEAVPLLVTDIGKVQQILYNFLSNAVKFTPARGRVDIRAAMIDPGTIRLSVTDTGCGIAEKDKDVIFEKFRQLDSSLTRESPGSGLGLAISKELATLLGGSVGCESQMGKGSTFWLDIPVTRTKEPQETEKAER
jgi:signal transduction histidine kinase